MSTYLFRYQEEIPTRFISALPAYYGISNATTKDVLFIRLLTGTLGFRHKNETNFHCTKVNYSIFPFLNYKYPSTKQLRNFLSPFSLDDFEKYSRKFYGRNINFHNNLLSELNFYLYYESKNLYQSSFVNLYRLYEYISYSFPLVHASHQGNLIGSYNSLKSFFIGEKTSEIKFFEMFVNNLFNGNPIIGTTSDFNFTHVENTVARNCYNNFYKLLKPNQWQNADLVNYTLSVENKYLVLLLKSLRNRYFHFAVGGQKNIGTSDIKDPEFFFSKVNSIFLNWFGHIFKEIIKENLDNSLI